MIGCGNVFCATLFSSLFSGPEPQGTPKLQSLTVIWLWPLSVKFGTNCGENTNFYKNVTELEPQSRSQKNNNVSSVSEFRQKRWRGSSSSGLAPDQPQVQQHRTLGVSPYFDVFWSTVPIQVLLESNIRLWLPNDVVPCGSDWCLQSEEIILEKGWEAPMLSHICFLVL
jgi:hypothetical protein